MLRLHLRPAALSAAMTLASGAIVVAAAFATVQAREPVTVPDADGVPVTITDTSRVITLGGVFTETAYALGAQDDLVGVDDSSFFPPQALSDKPTVGYYRDISAEPLLALDPTLIVGNSETGPPDVVQQLRDAGVPVLLLPDHNDVAGARDLITTLGVVLDRESEAADLVARLDADVASAQALVARATSKPRVLFVLQPPGAPLLVSGEVSAAGSMIDLAGGEPAFPGFAGYIPMTPEGIVAVNPDVILTTTSSVQELGGWDALLAQPGIAQTAAAENGRVVAMEDLYLMGFGPRTGQAIADLARLLHPELGS